MSAKHVSAGRLVAHSKVESALLVEPEGAGAVLDVPEARVLANPGVSTTADVEADGVGGHERKLAVRGVDEIGALAHVDELVLSVEATAHSWLVGSRSASVEIVPSI